VLPLGRFECQGFLRRPQAMNEGKSQVNILDGVVAGFSAFIGMTVERIVFGEQPFLIRSFLVVTIAVMTALCLNVAIRTFRKSKGQG
jgi:hypothetical protein